MDDQSNKDPGLCRRRLQLYLSRICNGDITPIKHNHITEQLSESEQNPTTANPISGISSSRETANAFLNHSKRQQAESDDVNTFSGIICECCFHPCSEYELSEYCGSKRRRKRYTSQQIEEFEAQLKSLPKYPNFEQMAASPAVQALNRQKRINVRRKEMKVRQQHLHL
ncbi:hypothetical protein EB796_025307 [Bugula neritina]|nr:hypothetical protein EB796_025307 [Bugula neritina]